MRQSQIMSEWQIQPYSMVKLILFGEEEQGRVRFFLQYHHKYFKIIVKQNNKMDR